MTNTQIRINQIAFQLGLVPPQQYRPPPHAAAKNRASGRTTNMILWALNDILSGHSVCFMAPTKEQAAAIVYRAREYCRQLGIDPYRVRRPIPYGVESNPEYWPQGVKVHRDHTLNHSGGMVTEPQITRSRGPTTGYHVTCPWCRRDQQDVVARHASVSEGALVSLECADCHQPILVHVESVRVTLKAWRDGE